MSESFWAMLVSSLNLVNLLTYVTYYRLIFPSRNSSNYFKGTSNTQKKLQLIYCKTGKFCDKKMGLLRPEAGFIVTIKGKDLESFVTDSWRKFSRPHYTPEAHETFLHITQVYIPKRRTLIQVLPPANAYTKYAHAYIHFAKFFCYLLMDVCIFIAIRPVCVHHGVRIGCLIAILRHNA